MIVIYIFQVFVIRNYITWSKVCFFAVTCHFSYTLY